MKILSFFLMLSMENYCTAAKYKNKYGRDPITDKKKSVHSIPVIVYLASSLTQIEEKIDEKKNRINAIFVIKFSLIQANLKNT